MRNVKMMAMSIKNEGFKASFKRYGWRMVSLVSCIVLSSSRYNFIHYYSLFYRNVILT